MYPRYQKKAYELGFMYLISEILFDFFLTLKLALKIWGRIQPRGVFWVKKIDNFDIMENKAIEEICGKST